jgi:hypothetical protein
VIAGVLKDLRRAPWTLWAYVALSVILVAVGLARADTHIHWQLLVFMVIFVPGISFLLLRGNRFVWWFIALTTASGLVIAFFGTEPALRIFTSLLGLGLVLAPPSRRYVFS